MNLDPRHRAQHHQLWIDKVRAALDDSISLTEIHQGLKMEALARLWQGTNGAHEKILALPPEKLVIEFIKHDLADQLPESALRAIQARGWPHRDLTPADWPSCQVKVDCAIGWLAHDILRGPSTQIMLLDDRTAKAVADSINDPITVAELQKLPHNPCIIEFHRPIEIAEKIKHGIRVRGVGFGAFGTEFPAAIVCFYLDSSVNLSPDGKKFPAVFCVWFGGFVRGTMEPEFGRQVGIEVGSEMQRAITEECKRVARNLWDFVTMRSINYDRIKRKPVKHLPDKDRPQHVQGQRSQVDR